MLDLGVGSDLSFFCDEVTVEREQLTLLEVRQRVCTNQSLRSFGVGSLNCRQGPSMCHDRHFGDAWKDFTKITNVPVNSRRDMRNLRNLRKSA